MVLPSLLPVASDLYHLTAAKAALSEALFSLHLDILGAVGRGRFWLEGLRAKVPFLCHPFDAR